MNRWLPAWLSSSSASLWKWIIVAGAIAACVVLIRNNAPYLSLGAAEHHEMRILDADEGSTFRGIWRMWNEHTWDYQKPIYTGYYYNTAVPFGAAWVPFAGNNQHTFALAARWYSLLQGCAIILIATLMVGAASGWHPVTLLIPAFLAFNTHFNYLSAVIRIDISMLLWLLPAMWAMARFLHEPSKYWYKRSWIFSTLAFSSKPAVLFIFPFLIALNAFQVFRDRQPFWREVRWRLKKGAKYWALTFMLTSPFSFFSFGLFVASLRSEMRYTGGKFPKLGPLDWFKVVFHPGYIGQAWFWASAACIVAFLFVLAFDWRTKRRGTPGFLTWFILVNIAWTLLMWGFVILSSKSYIDRYLDPGLLSLVTAGVASAAWLARRLPLVGWAAPAALLAALVAYLPQQWAQLGALQAKAASREEQLAPLRAFKADLESMLPKTARILSTPYVNFDSETYKQSIRFWRFRRDQFTSLRPEYLLISTGTLNSFDNFEETYGGESAKYDERKVTAWFFKQLRDSQLFGTVTVVREWKDPAVVLYRFKKPVDDAYIDWLFERVYKSAGVQYAVPKQYQ